MTKPRRHIAGQVAMLTRRCSERRYFLRPDSYINNVLPFEVGKAAERHGQHMYAAMAMSNHVHFGIGDTTGNRSDFMKDSMSQIARTRNRDLSRKGHFWEAGSFGDTVLLDRNAIERKLLYIWLNPVRAGLVKRAEDWPGFKILPRHWGKTIRIEKPCRFYGQKNPEVVEFIPRRPPCYDDMSLEEVRVYFQDLLRIAEDEIASLREELDLMVSGEESVRQKKPTDRPSTREPIRRHNPRFATKDVALMASAVATCRVFWDRYETRRQRWVKNGTQVTFPCGTVQLKRQAPIKCAAPTPEEPGLFAVS